MTTWTSEDAHAAIRAQALEIGFDVCRFAAIGEDWPSAARLREFLALGRHGEMEWMQTTAERRVHPRAMWPDARSAIVLGLSYGPDHDPRTAVAHPQRGAISVYAQGDDYHELIKSRLKALGRWMAQSFTCELKVFVDTAPLMEKPLAQQAGLGWQGKHTNLVSREHGSWLFLGSILTDMALSADEPESARCGSCTACLDVCPTNAFPAPFQLDARACISYLTIEHGGPIPLRYRAALGNRIYGCDDCLSACPWNKFAQLAHESAFHARAALRGPLLEELARLDDAQFRELFRKSPVKRIGRARFLRNVLYAIGNSGDPALSRVAAERLDDPSPLVRGAAVWALGRLLDAGAFDDLRREALGLESDPQVREEWLGALTDVLEPA